MESTRPDLVTQDDDYLPFQPVPTLAAIVLAGGKSQRMGQDKALISVNGVPLLYQVCQAALHCTPNVYVVTPWVERYQTLLPPTCCLIEEPCTEPRGPLAGFAHGLAQVQTEWVLLLACDLPRLQPEALRQWTMQLGSTQSEIALLPKGGKGWEPLCGFYRVDCYPRLIVAIEQGTRSFQQWLSQERVAELSVSDRSLLFNCNTPQDLASLAKPC